MKGYVARHISFRRQSVHLPRQARYWDGSGLWLLAKRLEKGRFVWPPIVEGAMTLTPAQLAVLIEAMDWRRTIAPAPPSRPMLV